MSPISDTSKNIIQKIRKILWVLGLHAFSLIIFFIFIDLIFGYFIFYSNVFLAEKETPVITGKLLEFNDKGYQDLLKRLNPKEQINIQPTNNIETPVKNNIVNSDNNTNNGIKTAYVLVRYLGYGDKGDDVTQIQKLLLQLGFLTETPNGNYDAATVNAIKKFQQSKGIKQTGNVAQSTKDALNNAFATITIK